MAVGGIIGAVFPALLMIFYMRGLLKGEIKHGNCKDQLIILCCVTAMSTLSGMRIVDIASAYGITTGTVLAGAVIGALSPITAALGPLIYLATLMAIFKVVEKVNEYIVSPVIEQIKGCFSSQGKNDNSSPC